MLITLECFYEKSSIIIIDHRTLGLDISEIKYLTNCNYGNNVFEYQHMINKITVSRISLRNSEDKIPCNNKIFDKYIETDNTNQLI